MRVLRLFDSAACRMLARSTGVRQRLDRPFRV
jgi:hypothetical protein